mgnify:CR=1 FL=1
MSNSIISFNLIRNGVSFQTDSRRVVNFLTKAKEECLCNRARLKRIQ